MALRETELRRKQRHLEKKRELVKADWDNYQSQV